jgi:hypothetical protein
MERTSFCAEIKITGMDRVAASALRRRQVSKPSSPGIMISSRTISGAALWQILRPVSPSGASNTS